MIERLELLGRADTDHADFVVSCGKGTYIRSLGRDLAHSLGTVGYLSALRRTAVGPFREEAAISLPKLEALGHIPALLGALAPVATALDDIPALALTEAQADRLRQGQPVLLTRDAPPSGAAVTRRDRQQAGGAGPFGRHLSQAGARVQPLSNGDPDVDYSRAQGGADQVVCPGQ